MSWQHWRTPEGRAGFTKKRAETAGWTDDRVELFRKLYSEGLSHSKIGTELDITRSASIGKAHRLGLETRERLTAAPRSKKRKAAGIDSGGGLATKIKFKIQRPPVLKPTEKRELRPDQSHDAVLFSERRERGEDNPGACAWPLWNDKTPADERKCCGSLAAAGHSYCPRHHRIAYVKPTDQRRGGWRNYSRLG